MRRYSRFDEDMDFDILDDLDESLVDDDIIENVVEELEDAQQEFYENCCAIIGSYGLEAKDLVEVSKYTDILDEGVYKGANGVKYKFDVAGWRRKKTHKGKKLSKTGGKFWGEGDAVYTGADAWARYADSDWFKKMRGVKPKMQQKNLAKRVGTDGTINSSYDF